MIRFLLVSLIVLALGIGAAWLAGHSGTLTFEFGAAGSDATLAIEMPVILAAAALLLAVLAAVLLYRLWRWLRHSPRNLGATRTAKRQREGYLALTRGLVAVAAGDAAEAQRYAAAASKRLQEPPLTLLLSAQAAQLAGNEAEAERHFTAMLGRRETEFLGLRGLLTQAIRRGDRIKALALAERARGLRPNTPWLLRELFSLQAGEGLWTEAEATLEQAVKAKALPQAESRQQRAALILQRAEHAAADERPGDALKLAEQAIALAPDFVPAVVLAARLQAGRGKARKALRLLADTWGRVQHPDLADAFLALHDGEDAAARLVAVRDFVSGQVEQPESRLLLARAAIAASDFALARRELETLTAGHAPSTVGARTAQLMAELEEKQYGDGASAREWLKRAAAAPPDAAWACSACGRHEARWSIRCPACGGFDTLHWQSHLAPNPALPAPATAPAAPA